MRAAVLMLIFTSVAASPSVHRPLTPDVSPAAASQDRQPLPAPRGCGFDRAQRTRASCDASCTSVL